MRMDGFRRLWTGGGRGLGERPGPLARLYTARLALVAAAASLALASLLWAVPALFSLAAFLVIALATALAPRRQAVRQLARERREARAGFNGSALALTDALPRPAFLVDERGRVRHVNPEAGRHFPAVRVGEPLAMTFRSPQLGEALSEAAAGRRSSLHYRERGEAYRVYAMIVSPMQRVAGEAFILVVLEDITERLALARTRADFVANASHELRTPLASLSGFIETLSGPAREDPEARERFLKLMLEQARRMRRLVDDLLSLSQLEMRVHQRPAGTADMAEVLRHVADSLAPLGEELKAQVELRLPEAPLSVRGDRDELIQVFENLVENALKYGASGGRVEIEAERAGTEARPTARVTVRDYGPGIAPEHLPRVTERFYRVDVASSREKQGTGLGLAIVKHIVTRHRGRLHLESPPEGGIRATVDLPLQPVEDEQAPPTVAGERH
jgi:two-component system, OmpR family, phosphate regulon sensor histidine kinase PhoR